MRTYRRIIHALLFSSEIPEPRKGKTITLKLKAFDYYSEKGLNLAIDIINYKISALEFEQLNKARKDVFFFAKHISVVHPIRGKVPFNLYPFQKAVLWEFLHNRFNIILKFRQAGITELISMYCLWLAMYHPHKNIVIISIKDRVAKKVLRKIKYMYKNLPAHLRVPIVNGKPSQYGTAEEMTFSNGSTISSIPTTEEAGRSEAVTLLVIDEGAIVRWANQIWAAALPTLSCLTRDSKILVRKKNGPSKYIELGKITPTKKGQEDISHMELEAFTHKGNWKAITHGVNKGTIETWEVEDKLGNILKATPAHRLLTTRGWKTVREIIDNDLNIISLNINQKLEKIQEAPITYPPKKVIMKPIDGFPKYLVSNMGKVYRKKKGCLIEMTQRPNKDGYLRVGLTNGTKRGVGSPHNSVKNKIYQKTVSRLVAEHFIGNIPRGYTVDHINCVRTDNYITNLQIIKTSENVQKSFKHNKDAIIGTFTGKKMPDLLIWGKIIEKRYEEIKTIKTITEELSQETGKQVSRKYVRKVLNKHADTNRLYISKLKLKRKFLAEIVDIRVEDDHSYITDTNFVNHNTGGSAIVNSTPYGIGNWYHKTWVDAVSGGNEFNAIRLRWDMHPERDENWYRTMSSSLGPRRTAQEIDGDFLSSGYSVFDLGAIKAIEDMLTEYKIIKSDYNGQFRIFSKPIPGESYFIGADVSTGRAQDYSAFSIMDRHGDEVGCFKGKMSVDKFADLLGKTGKEFNYAQLAPESNDIGLAVTSKLQNENYPNLYYSTKILKKKGANRPETESIPGWLTTSKNRSVIIDELEEDIRNENVDIKDPFFVQEAYTFIYDATNRPVALGKHRKSNSSEDDLEDQTYTDDAIMAKAITNHIRKGRKKSIIVAPQ